MRIARILNIDTELTELESKISGLKEERAALLTEELALSTGTKPSASPSTTSTTSKTSAPSSAAATAVAQPPRRRGRPPGKKNSPAAGAADPARATAKKKKGRARSRTKLTPEQAKEKVDVIVRAAGADGVSALQVAKSTGISYPVTATILKENFRKEGNRRDSRYYAD